jgi:hypothetical protein
MRVTSLLILVALIGGAAYIWFFQHDWLMGLLRRGQNIAEGYKPARSPSEAMEQFRKAVKDRNYQAAALYCTGDYAKELERNHKAARSIGQDIDKLLKLMESKNLDSTNSKALLYYLDPFPPNWKVSVEPKKKGDDKAVGGMFAAEESIPQRDPKLFLQPKLDPRLFDNVLLPRFPKGVVEVTREGSGDDAQWKLNIPLHPKQPEAIRLFRDKEKRIQECLTGLIDDARRGVYERKEQFESHMKSKLENALNER